MIHDAAHVCSDAQGGGCEFILSKPYCNDKMVLAYNTNGKRRLILRANLQGGFVGAAVYLAVDTMSR